MAAPQHRNLLDVALHGIGPNPTALEQYERDVARDKEETIKYVFLVPVTIIRGALLVPIAIYWRTAHNHNAMIESLKPLPQKYTSSIQSSEHAAATLSTILLYWHCMILVPCLTSVVAPFNLPVAVMDTVLAAYVAMIIKQQEAFVPTAYDFCRNLRGWNRTWQADNGYFVFAAQRAGRANDAGYLCSTFVREWQVEVAIVVLYFFIAMLEWFAFFIMAPLLRYQIESQKRELTRVFRILCMIPSVVAFVTKSVLYGIPKCLCRAYLPTAVRWRLRAARRFTIKVGTGVEQKTETELRIWKDKPKERYIETDVDILVPLLAWFLSDYNALMLLVQELHYTDVLVLAQTCRGVRSVVLPSHDYDRRLTVFRRYACQEMKERCWLCANQVCETCNIPMSVAQRNSDWHLESCRPYCDPCYQQCILQRRQTLALKWYPYCRCEPVPAQNLNTMILQRRQRPQRTPQEKPVCRECRKLQPGEILKRRNLRTRSELRHGLNVDGEKWTKCGRPECGNELSTAGPRWWVCPNDRCMKECTSLAHDAWRRSKQNEVSPKEPWYSRWYKPVPAPKPPTRQEQV